MTREIFPIQTLHAHTKNSDGKLSHDEVISVCKTFNISAVAFTDHDALLSQKQLEFLRKTSTSVRWISGIEVSSGWPKDIGAGASSAVHVVGLFVNPLESSLKEYSQKAIEARIVRMQRVVNNLNEIGIEVTEEECLQQSGGESVTLSHVVRALLLHEKNVKRIKEIKAELDKKVAEDEALKKVSDMVATLPFEQCPFPLFFTEESFIRGVYVDYLYYLDLDDSVALIRNAGGLAFLAHYFTCANKIDAALLEKIVQEKRLDGLETVFGLFAYGTPGEDYIVTHRKIVEGVISKTGALASGGADAHTTKDFEIFRANKMYGKDTVGLVENIIQKSGVSTEFSNIKI